MVRVIAATLGLFLTSAALADDWKEYTNRDYSFAVDFPTTPTVETGTYLAENGRSFPAHVFSVKQKTGEFKVTVVEMPGEKSGAEVAAIKDASKLVTGGGTVKFDALRRSRGANGRQLGIVGVSGSYSYVALFYRNNRLYQVEGNAFAAGRQAEVDARRFERSFDLT
jgi:hypothetical protein